LLELLDEREIEAVLSHELSRVRSRDVFGGVGDCRRRRGSSLGAVAWSVVAPIIALRLQLPISRTREYSADASGARLSGDPNALADALEKLEVWSARRPYELAGPVTATCSS
jgi:heat shock protein HtpX